MHLHQLGRLDAAVGLHRLRAIAAVLRAPAGLDRQQSAELDLLGRMELAMDGSRAEEQFGKGQVEEARDFLAGPVGTDLGQLSTSLEICRIFLIAPPTRMSGTTMFPAQYHQGAGQSGSGFNNSTALRQKPRLAWVTMTAKLKIKSHAATPAAARMTTPVHRSQITPPPRPDPLRQAACCGRAGAARLRHTPRHCCPGRRCPARLRA